MSMNSTLIRGALFILTSLIKYIKRLSYPHQLSISTHALILAKLFTNSTKSKVHIPLRRMLVSPTLKGRVGGLTNATFSH